MKANQLWLFVPKRIGIGWFYWWEWREIIRREYENIPHVEVPDTVSTFLH